MSNSLVERINNKITKIRRLMIINKVPKLEVKLEQFGNNYGGYKIATDYLAKDRQLTVLSFGIGEDLSFSEDVVNKLNSRVFAFDPTPRTAEYVAAHVLSNNENFKFKAVGLSSENKKETFYFPKVKEYISCSTHQQDWVGEESCEVDMNTFSKVVKDYDIHEVDILKMDIEGSEFDVMEQIFAEGLEIGQIGLEVHDYLFSDGTGMKKLKWLMNLLAKNSYKRVYLSASEHEMTFVK